MPSPDRDLYFLSEALPELQAYLLSNELYWPLSASQPRLTPGAVLLALARLHVRLPSDAQMLQGQLDGTRAKWRAAWDKKVARELSNRLLLWSNYLSDFANDPEQAAASYPAEVRGRAIIQILALEKPDFSEKTTLAELDDYLKASLRPSEFLWDAAFQPIFPKTTYWFLYGKL
jgi:hypothetical protein